MRSSPARLCWLFIALCLCAAESAHGQTLGTRSPAADTTRIAVFVGGNVRTVFAEEGDAANASGTLGIRRWGETALLSAQIAVAASTDTLTTGFGASMLAPAAGRALNSGLVEFTIEPGWSLPKLGMTGYLSAATHRWAVESMTDPGQPAVTTTWDVPVVGAALGVAYSFVRGEIRGDEPKQVEVRAYLAFSNRLMFGDLARAENSSVRAAILQTQRRHFFGLELGLNLQFESINADLVFYGLNGGVDGLNGGQIAAGIGITAELVSGILNVKK